MSERTLVVSPADTPSCFPRNFLSRLTLGAPCSHLTVQRLFYNIPSAFPRLAAARQHHRV